jgi:hypothetical protein
MATKTHEWTTHHQELMHPAPDPGITYDHMSADTSAEIKRTVNISLLSLMIEIITIGCLLIALLLSF